MTLTDAEIEQRIAALQGDGAVTSAAPSPIALRPTIVRPLTAAAESLIESLRVKDGIGLGLAEIDVLTRGFRPTDLVIITGFAHSGKTQLVNTMILNNPNKRVLFISLDDPAEMILAKLVAMYTGEPAEHLERRVREGDERAEQVVRDAASTLFSNVLVVDDVIGLGAMQEAVKQATEQWGAPPDAVVIDYLEMMPGGMNSDVQANVKSKANALKAWAKYAPFPLIVLHQGTRTNAKPGEAITMMSLGYSGEQQATIILGVRRKKYLADLDAHDRNFHETTCTLHIVKNKRPGGRCSPYEGVDVYIDPDTGRIRPIEGREAISIADIAARAKRT